MPLAHQLPGSRTVAARECPSLCSGGPNKPIQWTKGGAPHASCCDYISTLKPLQCSLVLLALFIVLTCLGGLPGCAPARPGIRPGSTARMTLPEYYPDPTYRLSMEERAHLLPWVDASAVEEFVSALLAEMRSDAVAMFGPPPGSTGNVSLTSPNPTGKREWDRVLARIYAPVREHLRREGRQPWTEPGPAPFWHPDWREP